MVEGGPFSAKGQERWSEGQFSLTGCSVDFIEIRSKFERRGSGSDYHEKVQFGAREIIKVGQ